MKNIGDQGELRAAKYLQQQGLKLQAQNFKSRFGELDLICIDQDTLVFVEVKFRSSMAFGGAAAAVTPAKQQKLRKAAAYYLQKSRQSNALCRFDVLSITQDKIEWLKNAF